MTNQTDIEWPICDEDGCIGVRLAATTKCLAHASEEERNPTLKQLGENGEIDARGVPITQALLEQILAAAPRDSDNNVTITVAHFDKATFQGDADFREVTFQGNASFSSATFHGDAEFGYATFLGNAWFKEVTFYGDTSFETVDDFPRDDAAFHRDADFIRATFHHRAGFEGVTFGGFTFFDSATFHGTANFTGATFPPPRYAAFYGATFESDAKFGGARFQADARFDEVTFRGPVVFVSAMFWHDARFDSAIFERARQVGPLVAYRGLHLDDAEFAQPVQIEANTIGLCCRRVRFAGGVQFRLRWARVLLDDTDLSAPSILAGMPRLTSEWRTSQEERIAKAWQRLLGDAVSERPHVLSLQRANVSGLGLAGVDLAECRFADAYNLDKLRLEGDVGFASAPVWLGWDWRHALAEECVWRRARRSNSRVKNRWTRLMWPAWAGDEPAVLDAAQLAGLYRALRKDREDAKDEPGAADFYYGEMEMRRHAGSDASNRPRAPSRGRVERGILTVYWLISGYGLRAWRALAWLAGLTAVFAVAFHLAGFTRPPQPVSYWTSLLYSFRATLSLTDPEVQLTAWGKLLQALLRLTGPVLLGLALLAVRARTKR